jgi:hypothetical protein
MAVDSFCRETIKDISVCCVWGRGISRAHIARERLRFTWTCYEVEIFPIH